MSDNFCDIQVGSVVVHTPLRESFGDSEGTPTLIFLSSKPLYNDFIFVAPSISSTILEIYIQSDQGSRSLKKEDRRRLQFLFDTVDKIIFYFSSQKNEVKNLTPFYDIFSILVIRMKEVLKMLDGIKMVDVAITSNFDIFELKLLGYLDELNGLFPLEGPTPSPLDVISDPLLRDIWKSYFGEVHFINFEKFLYMLDSEGIVPRESESYETIVKYLRYFLNFPSDDVITTFKFNHFSRLFGPDNFSDNFQRIVSTRGFLGLINRIQAYEILKERYPYSLLIRVSRTEPLFFAFSYKNKDGKLYHRINKSSNGNMIPVDEFINSKFAGYLLVNEQMDLDRVLAVEEHESSDCTLSKYAIATGGYF
jgi:hypothetical protein